MLTLSGKVLPPGMGGANFGFCFRALSLSDAAPFPVSRIIPAAAGGCGDADTRVSETQGLWVMSKGRLEAK